jgi:integrase
VRAFQVHLVATGISWPALNQIVCALRFFYGVTLGHAVVPERIAYAREPRKLPVVLSADEVVRFLEAIPSLKSRTALTTVYAAGLRVSEVVFLKVGDIDSGRMVIRVEQGKGGKDRFVMLSPQLLRTHARHRRRSHRASHRLRHRTRLCRQGISRPRHAQPAAHLHLGTKARRLRCRHARAQTPHRQGQGQRACADDTPPL